MEWLRAEEGHKKDGQDTVTFVQRQGGGGGVEWLRAEEGHKKDGQDTVTFVQRQGGGGGGGVVKSRGRS